MTLRTKYVVMGTYMVDDATEPVLNTLEEALAHAEKEASEEGRTYYVAEVVGGFKPSSVSVTSIPI